jgi:hypothetical protein
MRTCAIIHPLHVELETALLNIFLSKLPPVCVHYPKVEI